VQIKVKKINGLGVSRLDKVFAVDWPWPWLTPREAVFQSQIRLWRIG